MKTEKIDVRATIERATELLETETGISPAVKSVFQLLILLVKILADSNSLNSRNSSKPPSSDPNREKKKKCKGKRNPGGQKGHKGKTLCCVDDPDKVEDIKIDRRTLPKGKYKDVGYEARQVFDVIVSRHIIAWEQVYCALSKRCYPSGTIRAKHQSECGLHVTISAAAI